jgi:hypothetical protein
MGGWGAQAWVVSTGFQGLMEYPSMSPWEQSQDLRSQDHWHYR